MAKRDEKFKGFYEANLARLRRLAFRLTGDVSEAEDLAQETMVRVYRTWKKLAASPDPYGYARAVMLNRHRSVLRRARVELKHSAAPAPPRDLSEDDAVLWVELSKLPPRQRQVLVLHFYEDLPQTEIAEILGCPSGTVNSLVHRGLENLRSRINDDTSRSEVR